MVRTYIKCYIFSIFERFNFVNLIILRIIQQNLSNDGYFYYFNTDRYFLQMIEGTIEPSKRSGVQRLLQDHFALDHFKQFVMKDHFSRN